MGLPIRNIVLGSCRMIDVALDMKQTERVYGNLVYYPDEIIQAIRHITGEGFVYPENLLPSLIHSHESLVASRERNEFLREVWGSAEHVVIEVSSLQKLLLPEGLFASIRVLYDKKPPENLRRERYNEGQFRTAMDTLISLCGKKDVLLIPVYQFPPGAPPPERMDHTDSRSLIRIWLKQAADRNGKRFWDQSELCLKIPPSELYTSIDPAYHYSPKGLALLKTQLEDLLS